MNMLRNTVAAAALVAAAGAVSAQDVTLSFDGSATIAAGATETYTVNAMIANLGAGAFAGGGTDTIATDAASISTATVLNPFTTGSLPGTVSGTTLERTVYGQVSNIFGVNPAVDTGTDLDLYTVDVTAQDPCVDITLSLAVATNGGVLVYTDANGGASIDTATGEGGSSLTLNDLTVTCDTGVEPCPGDTNADNRTDADDFFAVIQFFGTGTTIAQGNFDGDAVTDADDFFLVIQFFGCDNNP